MVLSLLRLQHAMPTLTFHIVEGHSLIDAARAELAETFLRSDCDLLLWIDSDSVFEVETVQHLIAADVDMVGAAFAFKEYRLPAMAAAAARGEPKWQQAGLDFSVGLPEGVALLVERGIALVESIGCGLTLVKRSVFERMNAAYPALTTKVDEANTTTDKRRWREVTRPVLFHPMLEDGIAYGEDVSFCKRWSAIGGGIHVLVDGPDVGHLGTHEFRGSMLGSFAAQGMLVQPDELAKRATGDEHR